MLGVPLLREGISIGVMALTRSMVRPFSDKQIELVTTFADQAVIAIENVRLFDEVQARTRELTEALEQQTATSEVLQVISISPGELQPVFEAMLANATRLCEAKFGILLCMRTARSTPSRAWRAAALADLSPTRRFVPPPGGALDRLLQAEKDDPDHRSGAEQAMRRSPLAAELAGARTHIVVPMLKENRLIGAIAIYRQEVRPFTDKQIELVSNFAKQAVIAIENTRLLNELRLAPTISPNRCSSRPPPPTCSRPLAAQRSISKPCSTPWSTSAGRLCRGGKCSNLLA